MIDNYDSFTYNLVQYLGELGHEAKVIRNDSLSVSAVLDLNPSGVLIGPGPCTPDDAGICVNLIKQISKTEGRTISGQLRLVFDVYKKNVKKDELYIDRG